MTVRFIWKKSCDTCRKYKKQLDAWGVTYAGREMNAEPLTAEDLDALIGEHPVKPFLNTRNVIYRQENLKAATPDKATAVALIAAHNNLLKRPVLIVGDEMIIGNNLARAAELLGHAL
jgi:arsenate reductase-like glutaredoxin family protein